MNDNTNPATGVRAESADVMDSARALERASLDLCRATLARPHLTPADVDVVLAHLAAAAAALPQAARQLSDILDEARHDRTLVMDTLSDIEDPGLAIDSARLHLDATCDSAVTLYRHFDAAHQQAAHIATASDETYLDDEAPRALSTSRRNGNRVAPQMRANERGGGVPR